jgi:hypothetical protein
MPPPRLSKRLLTGSQVPVAAPPGDLVLPMDEGQVVDILNNSDDHIKFENVNLGNHDVFSHSDFAFEEIANPQSVKNPEFLRICNEFVH